MKKLPKADVSAYRLRMFEDCPRALRYYNAGFRMAERDVATMNKGKVLHRAIEDVAMAHYGRPGHGAMRPDVNELLQRLDHAATVAGLAPEDHQDVRAGAVESVPAIDLSYPLVKPERRYVLPLDGELHYEVRFDFVAQLPSGVVVARDWKTGAGMVPADDDVSSTPQVGLYLMALHQLWPDAHGWEVHYVYTRHNKVIRVPWTEQRDKFWRARAVAAVRAWQAGFAQARVSEHCGDCGFRFVCQAWLSVLVLRNGREGPYAEFGDGELLRARAQAKVVETLSGRRRKDLDKEIKKRLRTAPGRKLEGDGYEAKLHERETNKVAVEALLELAQLRDVDVVGLLAQAIRVSSTKALKIPKDDREKAVVERWRTKKRSWTLRVREKP